MRTGEEILNKAVRDYYINADKWLMMNKGVISQITKEIDEEMKETIKECAERATVTTESDYNRVGELYDYEVVDKESILSLIKELK